MINDENQLIKMKRREYVLDNIDFNFETSEKEKRYFLDLIDELSITKDLANGEINLAAFTNLDSNTLNRMYRVGSFLNKSNPTDEQISEVYSYIDSCCVEYGKMLYEVGMVNFTNGVKKIINGLYGDVEFHEGVIKAVNTFDVLIEDNTKKPKTMKKSI